MQTIVATVDRDPGTISCKVRVVEVWVAFLLAPAAVGDRLIATLKPDERARADGYRFTNDSRRFSVARGWLRQVLGVAMSIPATEVRFVTASDGKPRLAADRPRFNLSHASELAVIAVSDGEVGVIEPESSAPAALEAAVACTPAEPAALDALPAQARAAAALRLWTAKEAYLKATGEGLTVGPD